MTTSIRRADAQAALAESAARSKHAERQRQWVLEGLADVDAGRVIDDEDVKRWAASLDSDTPLPLPSPRSNT